MNKDERVWVCFEMSRVQIVHAVQSGPTVRRVPTMLAILKNYRKYRQHGTSLNKNKVNCERYSIIKGEIKDKKLWFWSIISFHLLQLIAQSIFVRL